ncbi:hypothetical protein CR513_58299, partial [Mucuna pruriens]
MKKVHKETHLVRMGSISKEIKVPTEVDDPYLSAALLCFSRVMPAILNAAIDLNLFDIIAKAQTSSASTFSASQIASLLPNQHPHLPIRLERILPVLASYSLLNCSIRTNDDGKRERVYTLSPVGECFAFSNEGTSVAPLSTLSWIFNTFLCHVMFIRKDVKNAILEPNCNTHFENVYGMPLFQYMEGNTELNNIFFKAMTHAGPLGLAGLLKFYKGFEGISTLVDVGGGAGENLKLIVSAYPSIKGINFDLPQMIQNAPPYPGIEHIGGDMFESVPQGDAILLKFVCHNWSDEDCIKFLRNCHKALPQHGKVIIMDYIVPEVPNSSDISKHTCTIDSLMFLAHGGKERTENEFENLCKSSGFSKFHVAFSGISSTMGVAEFYK